MEIRLALVSHLVLFVLGPVDALSPSPSLNHNSRSNSSGTSTSSLSPSSSSLNHNSSNSSVTPISSHFIQSTSKPTGSSPRCHQLKLSVCWLNSPPYLFKDDDTGNISGAFNEVIELLLSKCKNDCNPKPAYKWCENSSSKLNYSYQVENATELTECIEKSGFDIVFPVLNSHVKNQNFYKVRFQDIISPPGIAVLKNREVLAEKARWNVIKEFSEIWTVIVLALLLNAIFGILIWVLDSRSNAEEFPRSFLRGSVEGIWWAFVTMATVGYGDKAPKSFLARLLSILWMFTSVAVMAYLTATMTTALISGIVTDHRKIVNTEFMLYNLFFSGVKTLSW